MRVGLFASVHSPDIWKSYGYSEDKIIELFDKFQPDIICGEVRREDYESNADYQGPGEYRRFIFRYCSDRDIKFEPCDWFNEKTVAANNSLAEIDLISSAEYKKIMEEYLCEGEKSAVPFNSERFNEIVRKKQAFQKKSNPDIHKVVWEDRNSAIIHNIVNVIKNNPQSDILIIFGAEHIYRIMDELLELEDIQIVFPLYRNK